MRVSFITLLLLCYALLVSVLQKWHPCKYFWPAVYFIKHLYNLYTICFHIVSLVITSNISLCITPIKLIKSLLYYLSTFHQYNFTNVLLFKSAIYVFNVTSTEKFPEQSKLLDVTIPYWQFCVGKRVGKKRLSFWSHNKPFISRRLVWSCWLNIGVVLSLVDWRSRIFM